MRYSCVGHSKSLGCIWRSQTVKTPRSSVVINDASDGTLPPDFLKCQWRAWGGGGLFVSLAWLLLWEVKRPSLSYLTLPSCSTITPIEGRCTRAHCTLHTGTLYSLQYWLKWKVAWPSVEITILARAFHTIVTFSPLKLFAFEISHSHIVLFHVINILRGDKMAR